MRSDIVDGGFEVPLPEYDLLIDSTHDGDPVTLEAEVAGVGRTTILLDRTDAGWSCSVDAVEAYVILTGTVYGTEGLPTWVDACGHSASVAVDGTYRLETEATVCTVWARRQEEGRLFPFDPIDLDTRPGESLVIDFHLPPAPTAGFGVGAELREDGARLSTVDPGSAAETAGLRPGDVVLAIDDLDAAGLDPSTWASLAAGPECSEVALTVLRDDEELELTLVRKPLGPVRQE